MIKAKEVRIVKEVKGVMACDVSPVAMFFMNFPLEASENEKKISYQSWLSSEAAAEKACDLGVPSL